MLGAIVETAAPAGVNFGALSAIEHDLGSSGMSLWLNGACVRSDG